MRNRWNQGVVAVLACLTIVFTGCASMQTTMTNVGNSLAFWKKSAPKDQFATNLTSPAATGTPTGAYGPNSIAQNQPSSYPFANTGNRQNDSSQDKFGQNANVASNTPASGTRTPYNTPYQQQLQLPPQAKINLVPDNRPCEPHQQRQTIFQVRVAA